MTDKNDEMNNSISMLANVTTSLDRDSIQLTGSTVANDGETPTTSSVNTFSVGELPFIYSNVVPYYNHNYSQQSEQLFTQLNTTLNNFLVETTKNLRASQHNNPSSNSGSNVNDKVEFEVVPTIANAQGGIDLTSRANAVTEVGILRMDNSKGSEIPKNVLTKNNLEVDKNKKIKMSQKRKIRPASPIKSVRKKHIVDKNPSSSSSSEEEDDIMSLRASGSEIDKFASPSKDISDEEEEEYLNDIVDNLVKEDDRSEEVHPKLAAIVNDYLKKQFSKDKIVKKLEDYKTPHSVDLSTRKCNPEVWKTLLEKHNRSFDIKLQKTQNATIKSMNAVTKATDSLLKIKNNLAQTTQKELKSELEKVILVCTDALALSAYSHEVTEQTRRDAMAYKFTPEQRGLCHNVPNDSKLLFGDDLNKRLTDATTN